MSPLPADTDPERDRPEPHIRLLPSAFTATAGGEPASPEAAYRAILETAIDAIMTIDAQGRIVAHNAAACHMFGYGSDDLLGAHMANLVPDADRAALVSTIATYVSDAVRGAPATGLEMDALHADGRVFPVHLAIGGMGRGARRLFTIIVRDRSAERAAAVTRAATEREREAFQRVTEAVATGAEPDAAVPAGGRGGGRSPGRAGVHRRALRRPADRAHRRQPQRAERARPRRREHDRPGARRRHDPRPRRAGASCA